MVTFPDKFCKTEIEKLHAAVYLDNGYLKILDPESLTLKDNFTLFNIGFF